MQQRSKQNNPEQKTKNGINNKDMEFGAEVNPVQAVKKRNLKRAQPQKAKENKN